MLEYELYYYHLRKQIKRKKDSPKKRRELDKKNHRLAMQP